MKVVFVGGRALVDGALGVRVCSSVVIDVESLSLLGVEG